MVMEKIIPVADTGFVVALTNRTDRRHPDVTPLYQSFGEMLLPQTALVEVAYLIGRTGRIDRVCQFLRGLPASRFRVIALTDQDVARIADNLEENADSRIDFVDASVMAIAERYDSETILTLDRRDFSIFRPAHCPYFKLLP